MGKAKRLFAPHHRTIKAVDDVTFEIRAGEILGYLGPNGAGKSTTIKLLTGVLVPTAGSVEVNGITPYRDRRRNAYQVGVVYGQRSQLWWDLPLLDSFEILGAMYRIPRPRYRDTLDSLVDLLQMEAFIDQPVRKLSLGQKMRGDIAASLLHEPPGSGLPDARNPIVGRGEDLLETEVGPRRAAVVVGEDHIDAVRHEAPHALLGGLVGR